MPVCVYVSLVRHSTAKRVAVLAHSIRARFLCPIFKFLLFSTKLFAPVKNNDVT